LADYDEEGGEEEVSEAVWLRRGAAQVHLSLFPNIFSLLHLLITPPASYLLPSLLLLVAFPFTACCVPFYCLLPFLLLLVASYLLRSLFLLVAFPFTPCCFLRITYSVSRILYNNMRNMCSVFRITRSVQRVSRIPYSVLRITYSV